MSLLSELRRRNVHRMALLYLGAAWLIMQVVDLLIDRGPFAESIGPITLTVLAIGFPIALIISWFYELTPEGISLDTDEELAGSATGFTGRRVDFVIISLLAAAVLVFAYDKWWIPAPPAQSIAVLPFSNRSALDEDAYFVDGIHDDILTQLAKLSSFGKVISRTSMEQYRETSKSLPQIGQELGVATILEGSVQRAGDRVRINAQLIEAATDEHLWAETYERQLTVENIFLVQEQIARDVARALRVTLTIEEDIGLARLPTASLDAYRLYQLGSQMLWKGTADTNERALEYFDEAIRADPDYAQAYAGLANATAFQWGVGGRNREDALGQAKPLAERAIQLDPTLAEGYAALGAINWFSGQWTAAESNFDTAIALNPGLVEARTNYGYFLFHALGKNDEAILQLETATRLSPLDASAHTVLGGAYARTNRTQEALDTLDHALNLDPDTPFVYEALGDVYGLNLGRLDEAVKWYTRGLEQDPSSAILRPFLAAFYLDLGDTPTARLLIEQQVESALHGHVGTKALQVALLLYSRQYEEALELANEDWQGRELFLDRLLQDVYSLNAQYQRALEVNDQRIERLEDKFPHPETQVNADNLGTAIYRAAILQGIGENVRAQRLLISCLEVAKTAPSGSGYLIANFHLVQIYTLMGDVPNALLALRESIDAGMRSGWWIELLHSPITAPLRKEPQFQEMVEEIRTEMAAQLEHVREMKRTGEIPPLPVVNP